MQDDMEIYESNRSIQAEKKELAKSRNLGMGWYSFIVNFASILGMIQFVYNGLMAISGMGYVTNGTFENMEMVKLVYSYMPSLKVIDVVYGIIMLVLSVILFNVRSALKEFRIGAVKALKNFYLLQILVVVLRYTAMHIFVVRLESGDITSAAGTILSLLIMYLIQSVYFYKREFLFTE